MTDKSSAFNVYAAQEDDCKVLYVVVYSDPKKLPVPKAIFGNPLGAEIECDRLSRLYQKPLKRYRIVAYVPKQFAKREESENDEP